jgi:hypothetical protein
VAIVVTPTVESCTELWADPVKFIEQTDHTYETLTEADVELAIAEATWVLWSLSHYRYHGYQCWEEDYALHAGQSRLELEQWPVDEVLSVSAIPGCTPPGDEGTSLAGWCYVGKGEILLPSGYAPSSLCPPSAGHVRVRYRTKPNVPFGTERAVMRLADEYLKAFLGQSCRLPERITSVTRQGVSWTVLDPMDFMQKGMTGLGAVDHWLSVANGRGPAHMTDPLLRGRVMRSVQTGCGEGCQAPLEVVDYGPYNPGELPYPGEENPPPDPPPEYDWGMQTARYVGLTGDGLPADATFESPDAIISQDAGVNRALIVWDDVGTHPVTVKDGSTVVATTDVTFDIDGPGKLLSVSPDTIDYNGGPYEITLTGVDLDQFVARVGTDGGKPVAYRNVLQVLDNSLDFDVISSTQIVVHGYDPSMFAVFDRFEFRMEHRSEELPVDEFTTRHYTWVGNPVWVTITGAP